MPALAEIFDPQTQPAPPARDRQLRLVAGSERQNDGPAASTAPSDALLRALARETPDLVLVLDRRLSVRYAGPSITAMIGLAPGAVAGTPLFTHVHPDNVARMRDLLDVAQVYRDVPAVAIRVRHADGTWRSLEMIVRNLLHDRAVKGIVITARDVTERKRVEEQLLRLAFHDPLTGLPNRALFMDRLMQAVASSERGPRSIAVLYLDLNEFKRVNDTHGHAAGDELLVRAARRMTACLRPADTVARLGGDEFTILLDGVATAEDAMRVARRLAASLRRPFGINGQTIRTSASVGVVFSQAPCPRPDELLHRADGALYQAKSRRKERVVLATDGGGTRDEG